MSDLDEVCINHKAVKATHRCLQCKAPLCATCVITFYETNHYCPNCASMNEGKLTPKRRNMIIGSYVAAAFATLMLIGLFGMFAVITGDTVQTAASTIISVLLLGSAITGVALGFGAIHKGLKNPFSIWVAAIWNLVMLLIYFIISIIGLTMK